MNFAAISIVSITIFAIVFATDAGTKALAGTPVALFSVFSIFAAAVLVRLNRGLPAVEWKLVDKDSLKDLLDAVEAISKDYVWVLGIILAGIVATVALFVLGENVEIGRLKLSNLISGVCGGIFGLSIGRMSHLVWLDLDIVRLQRKVVESSADQRQASVEHQGARNKLSQMKEAMSDVRPSGN